MAVAHSPLRRWKRFFPAFDAIDAAIAAAGQSQSESGDDARECLVVVRPVKADTVQDLCDAAVDDAAEDLCRTLDNVMYEYLVALTTAVPVMSPSTCVAKAVGALQEHESGRIRGLARGIIRMWTASRECDVARARARVEELIMLSDQALAPRTGTSSAAGRASSRVEPSAKRNARNKTSAPLPRKKSAPVVGARPATASMAPMDRMEANTKKRKLREGSCQEAANAKRQRKAIVGEAPNRTSVAGKAISRRAPVAAANGDKKRLSAPCRTKRACGVRSSRAEPAKREGPARGSAPLPKKRAPVAGTRRANTATIDKTKLTTKTPAAAGYQEAPDAKRQSKIQSITPAPKTVEQKQRKTHPVPTTARRS